jgi:hypothetical protein
MIPTLSLRISLITSLLMLSGCGLNIFSSPKSPVVIDDIESRIGTLAVSTDRRVVLVRLEKDAASAAGRFCAEPPLDTDQNVTNALATIRDLSTDKIDASVKAELTRNFSQISHTLVRRTQGLQLYRAAMYNLCQNYLNHAINEQVLQAQATKILELSVKLIELELPRTPGKLSKPALHVPAAAPVSRKRD